MGDKSDGKRVSNTKQTVYNRRNESELSSDCLPDDTNDPKTKDDLGLRMKSDSNPSGFRLRMFKLFREYNVFRGGHGTRKKADMPGVPSVTSVSSDRIDIEWDPSNTFCQGDGYEVQIKNIQNGKRTFKTFTTCRGRITDLEPATTYTFKVCLKRADGKKGKYSDKGEKVKTMDKSKLEVGPPGIRSDKTLSSDSVDIVSNTVDDFHYEGVKGGKYGENREQVTTKDASSLEVKRPGKPAIKCVSWDSVDIEWDSVASFCNGDVYQVRCENTKSRKWNCQNFEINSGKIMGLEPGNSYSFKVRLVKSGGEEGKYGETSKEVKTQLQQDLPGKPFIKDVSSDSVDIIWNAVSSLSPCDVYQIRIENTKDKKWYCLNFETNSGKILDLIPSTSYTFKVRLVKENGEEGTYGETSEEVSTKKEPIPGKPSVKYVFADRVTIIWEHVDTFCKGDVYEVHVENIDTQEKICQTFDQNSATIEDLQPDSRYVFKVRLVKQDGKLSKFSGNSDWVTTSPTFASKLIHTQYELKSSCKGPALYELPLDEVQHATNADARSIKYEIGPTGRDQIVEKTIMLVGATGTGKSTFVDSLANYVLGVRLTDPYRFTVMRKEDREKQMDQAISQTDWITCYTFNPQEGTRLTYRLNVIDSPGFGDTRGRERDKEIIDQIHKLFKAPGEKGVQTIDAVCFFVKASDCRLSEAQSYIFSAIQSLFGKDIKENICLLITFADGSYPAVMAAVRKFGLPYGGMFSFNNLPWFSDPKESAASLFWKMGLNSCTALFNHLGTLETKSLQLTKEVLKERQLLQLTSQNLHTHINNTMFVLHNINREMKILQENIDVIDRNKKFTYTVTELKVISVDLPPNERATNCLTCMTTCHRNCSSVFQSFPRMCRVINWFTKKCNQCKCYSDSHETTGYRFDTCEETVEKTYEDMQKRFEDATEKFLTVNEVLNKMKSKQEVYIAETRKMLNTMLQCKNRLNEIALRPDQFCINEYIEQLIKAERTERQSGFQDRIEQLTQFREEARSLDGSQNTAIKSDN